MTLNELIEAIKLRMDPYILLEVLDLDFDELVDALSDTIEDNYEAFVAYLEEEDDDD